MADPRRRKSKAIQGWRGAAATTASLVRRAGWRRSLIATVLLCAFASGFYIAQLYSEISALIEERRAALTSSIYSAPLVISPGDEVAQLHLVDRLDHLSYTRVENPAHPGQYSMVPGAMTINVRDFRIGSRGFPATFLHLTFDGSRVSGIADSFGVAMPAAMIEPEVVGRLMPDMPAERAEVSLSEMPPYLPKGLLATEDRFFYYHFGFDPVRIIEAAILDFHAHRLPRTRSSSATSTTFRWATTTARQSTDCRWQRAISSTRTSAK